MSLLALFLTVVIWGLIFYILWWGLGKAELPEPWNKVAIVLLVLATVVILIGIFSGTITPFPIVGTLLSSF